MIFLSLRKIRYTQWVKSKTSVDAVFVLPSQPKKFRLKAAASLIASRV
jgi:hypothetical protein